MLIRLGGNERSGFVDYKNLGSRASMLADIGDYDDSVIPTSGFRFCSPRLNISFLCFLNYNTFS